MIRTLRHPQLDEEIFQQLMKSHEQAFDSGKRINDKGHQSVSECKIDGRSYIIKRYAASSPLSAIRLLLGRSRVDTSFRYADKLQAHGLAVATHWLVIKHLTASNSRAYLVMEKAPGISMFEYVKPGADLVLHEAAINNAAKLIADLHKQGIAHGDLHTRNLIIDYDNNVKLIDFDNTRYSMSGVQKDLKRFREAVAVSSSYEPRMVEALIHHSHPLLLE